MLSSSLFLLKKKAALLCTVLREVSSIPVLRVTITDTYTMVGLHLTARINNA